MQTWAAGGDSLGAQPLPLHAECWEGLIQVHQPVALSIVWIAEVPATCWEKSPGRPPTTSWVFIGRSWIWPKGPPPSTLSSQWVSKCILWEAHRQDLSAQQLSPLVILNNWYSELDCPWGWRFCSYGRPLMVDLHVG